MDTAALGQAFQANKVPLLAAAGAGVAGLALYRKRKGATAGPATTTVPTAAAAGTYSGGAQLAGTTGGVYDSTGADLGNALDAMRTQLGQLGQAANTPPTPVPASPLASTLTGAVGTGTLVHFAGDNYISEVESDGSLYHLMPSEFARLQQQGRGTYTTVQGYSPTNYTGSTNLATMVGAKSSPLPVYKP